MIWGSVLLITGIDLFIMAVGVYVGIRVFINRGSASASQNLIHQLLVGTGLSLIVIFFAMDLLLMWVLPPFVGMKTAMAAMENLHLNVSWVIFPMALCFIALGFLQSEAQLTNYNTNLESLVEERTEKLKNAQYDLVRKERLAALGQLTAMVSHELRNPLGAMRTSLYIINKKSDLADDKLRNAIERIDRNINRCDQIINEMLDFSRITELDREPILIDSWLEEIIEEQFFPPDIRLEKGLTLKDFEFSIDPDRMRRAVINVLENACQAMVENNSQGRVIGDAQLFISTRCSNERVEILVCDTGPGIKPEVLVKIFEPLFSTRGFGVGLGLSVVEQIMKQHCGGVEIDSKEGEGTTVVLWVPLKIADNDGVAA